MNRWLAIALGGALALTAACGKRPAAPQAQIDERSRDIDRLRQDIAQSKAQISRLASDNEALRRERDALRTAAEEAAQEAVRLKQLAEAGRPATPLIRARVLAVDGQMGFVVIDRGESDGIREGQRFDIVRGPDAKKVGVGEFERYVGTERRQSKLRVVEGRARDMTTEDGAVAQ